LAQTFTDPQRVSYYGRFPGFIKVLQTCDGGWLRTSVANVTISERYVKCFWWVKLSTGVWPELNVPAGGAFPPFHDLTFLVHNAHYAPRSTKVHIRVLLAKVV